MNDRQKAPKPLIFTDLDGCLLDHHDYSLGPAAALLKELAALNIPVIPASSKTAAELLHLRQAWDNKQPFIIENGAAAYIPQGYFAECPAGCEAGDGFWIKRFSQARRHWLELIHQSHQAAGQFKTFADAGIEEIAEMTGLDLAAAARASLRQYGEPLAWYGSERQRAAFIAELKQAGASVKQGGRFLHVSGDCDKGLAMNWLLQHYRQAWQQPLLSIAIGDSPNDIGMLEAADIAVLIPSPTQDLPRLNKTQNLHVASQPGPIGWADSVAAILRNLNVQ